jgi:hypothetical protein
MQITPPPPHLDTSILDSTQGAVSNCIVSILEN